MRWRIEIESRLPPSDCSDWDNNFFKKSRSPFLIFEFAGMRICDDIFLLIKSIDRFGAQQRLLHQIHLPAVHRLDLYAKVHIIGNGEEGKVGAAGWWSWCLPIGERRRDFWWIRLLLLFWSLNSHPLAASLCWLSALAGVHKLAILAGEFSALNSSTVKRIQTVSGVSLAFTAIFTISLYKWEERECGGSCVAGIRQDATFRCYQ